MTERQRQIARHMLGLDSPARRSYRNYYVAGEGYYSFDELIAMESYALMDVVACRSCRAPIIWMRTEGGKAMPVDRPDGVLLGSGETFEVARKRLGADRVVSHFATCPNASGHRRKRA